MMCVVPEDAAEVIPAPPSSGEDSGRVVLTTIPVAPPANLVNPDKPVAMASAPAHINTASALTKQKLLQTIQMKEQQKLLEQTIAQQLGQSPEILAQALKMIPVSKKKLVKLFIFNLQNMNSNISEDDGSTFLAPTEIPARRYAWIYSIPFCVSTLEGYGTAAHTDN